MKRSLMLVLGTLLSSSALAVAATGNVKADFVFGDGLAKTYKISVDVPNGLKSREKFGELIIEQSFFKELRFDMYSHVPRNIGFGGKNFVVQDSTANREIFLVVNKPEDFQFKIYRRIDPRQPKIILVCEGNAEDKAAFDAMVKICRSARLK